MMKTIKVYCKTCGSALTSELTEIPETDLCWEEEMDVMSKNNFCIWTNPHTNIKYLLTAIDDYNLKNHPDTNRFQGCCGSDGANGLNKLCLNGHEVATEISDCWTGRYLEFDFNTVLIKEVTDVDTYKELKL